MTAMSTQLDRFLHRRPDSREAVALEEISAVEPLMQLAATLRDGGHGDLVTYSPKVFIPLTVPVSYTHLTLPTKA